MLKIFIVHLTFE